MVHSSFSTSIQIAPFVFHLILSIVRFEEAKSVRCTLVYIWLYQHAVNE